MQYGCNVCSGVQWSPVGVQCTECCAQGVQQSAVVFSGDAMGAEELQWSAAGVHWGCSGVHWGEVGVQLGSGVWSGLQWECTRDAVWVQWDAVWVQWDAVWVQ